MIRLFWARLLGQRELVSPLAFACDRLLIPRTTKRSTQGWDTVFNILDAVPRNIQSLSIVAREVACFKSLDWLRLASALRKFKSLSTMDFRVCRGDAFRSRELKLDVRERIASELSTQGIKW